MVACASIYIEALNQGIQNLPIKVDEKIYKYYVTAKLIKNKRARLG